MPPASRPEQFREQSQPVARCAVPERSLEEYVDVLSLGTLHALPDCVVHRIVRRQVVVLKHLLSVLEDPDLVQKHVM